MTTPKDESCAFAERLVKMKLPDLAENPFEGLRILAHNEAIDAVIDLIRKEGGLE